MFTYELCRYNLCVQQLKAVADAGALCAAATNTGSTVPTPQDAHLFAMDCAFFLMTQQNTILDQSLTATPMYTYDSSGGSPPTWTLTANSMQVYYQFLDPTTNPPNPVAYTSANAKIMRVFVGFGFVPDFAKFIGLGPNSVFPTQVYSDGALPMLDVVLCFDMSQSMDDFTNVTLIQRYYDNTYANTSSSKNGGPDINAPANANRYTVPKGPFTYTPTGDTTAHMTVQGPLYYAVQGTNTTGLSINGGYPMFMDQTGNSGEGTYTYTSTGHGTHNGARAPVQWNSGGQNPNNTFTSSNFSDIVVHLDGTGPENTLGKSTTGMGAGITLTSTTTGTAVTFPAESKAVSTSSGGYGDDFWQLGTLAEAMRGNLESTAAADLAYVDYKKMGVTPGPGFFAAYYQAVQSCQTGWPCTTAVVPLRHPIGDAVIAANSFFGILNNDADTHFGLVTFSNVGEGTSYTSTISSYPLIGSGSITGTSVYPTSSTMSVPQPQIFLNNQIGTGAAYTGYDTSSPADYKYVDGALWTTKTGEVDSYGVHSVCADGSTDIGGALEQAELQLFKTSEKTGQGASGHNLARSGATRAIVLFTDGLPTVGVSAQTEASACASPQVPIYCIGLCLTKSLQASQQDELTDCIPPNAIDYTNGIAYLSQNQARFYQTTSSTQLNQIFSNVARQLVQLIGR